MLQVKLDNGTREKVDGIVFDLDGTLYQTKLTSVKATILTIEELRRRHGDFIPVPAEDEVVSRFGLTVEDYVKSFLGSRTGELGDEFESILHKLEMEFINERGRLYDGAGKTLETLHSSRIPLGIATNASRDYLDAITARFGIRKLFLYTGAISEHPGKQKDHLLAVVKQKMGISRCLMVGDRKKDMDAARANGDVYAAARWGFAPPGELDGAEMNVASMEDLLSRLN